MDIFFHDPEDLPVPPEEVKIREFTATPYPDGKRIRIYLEITPFQKAPSGEVHIKNSEGRIMATASIIETMTRKMELTLHMRGSIESGEYSAHAELFYQDTPSQESNGESQEVELPEKHTVDFSETGFTINI